MGKIIQDYLIQQQLGSGAFGKVFKAFNIKTNQTVAIKVIPKQMFKQTPKLQQCLQNQIKILNLMTSNQYIITLIKAFRSSNNFYMVYQYCNGSTLSTYLKTRRELKQHEAMTFFTQLIHGFKELHKHQILHRDIKPENIFMHNGGIKLGDFGFCKSLKEGDLVTTTMIGSPIYMAPEVIKGQAYTSKADIWSLGVVLYQMLYGVCPFESSSIAGLILSLHNNHLSFPKRYGDGASDDVVRLLGRLLEKDQFKRISWEELFRIVEKYEDKQKAQKVKEEDHKRITIIKSRNSSTSITRPISNYLSYEQPKFTKLLQQTQRDFRRTSSNEKLVKPVFYKNPESPRTDDSTTNGSKASIIQEPNLSSRFQVNRLLNNFSKQITLEIQTLISTLSQGTYLTKMLQVQRTHKKFIEAANLAVDIFIDDQKQGVLYYYLILNKVRSSLTDLIPNILPDQSTLSILATLKNQFSLLEKELVIFRDYLIFKGVIVDDILDIPTYLKIKELSLSFKSDLWDRMFKYFSGNSTLHDCGHLKFNHSYSAKNSMRKEEGELESDEKREQREKERSRVSYY